jgi:hypothetical protein
LKKARLGLGPGNSMQGHCQDCNDGIVSPCVEKLIRRLTPRPRTVGTNIGHDPIGAAPVHSRLKRDVDLSEFEKLLWRFILDWNDKRR